MTADEYTALCKATETSSRWLNIAGSTRSTQRCVEPASDKTSDFIKDVEQYGASATGENAAERQEIIYGVRNGNCGQISDALAPIEHADYILGAVSKGGLGSAFTQGLLSAGYNAIKLDAELEDLPPPLPKTGNCDVAPFRWITLLDDAAAIVKGMSNYRNSLQWLADHPDGGHRIPVEELDKQTRDFVEKGRIVA